MLSENTNVDISLHQAAKNGQIAQVKDLLAAGADFNAADGQGKTPLYQAAQNGHKEIVKDLLAAGADANAADQYGRTALYWAAYKGHKDIILLLLVAGADPSLMNINDATSIYLASNDEIRKLFADAEGELKKIQDKKIGKSKVLLSEFLLADLTNEDNLIRYAHNSKLIQGLEGIKEQFRKDCPILAEMMDAQCEAIDERRRLVNEALEPLGYLGTFKEGQKIKECWEVVNEDVCELIATYLTNTELEKFIADSQKCK